MLLKPFAVAAAGLAATCTAFLLPPELSEADVSIADALSLAAPDLSQKQSISLDCPGCPIQLKNRHGHIWVKNGKQNHLELNFNIEQEDNGADRLLLNGFELYPNSNPFHNVLTAPQVWDKKDEQQKDDGEKTTLKSHHKARPHHKEVVAPQLGFSLQIHPAAHDTDGQQYKIVALDLQIIEVGNRFVDGIPNVHVKLIKDAAGALMIGKVETTTSQTLQTAPVQTQNECASSLMCKWLEIVKDKLSHMKGQNCHGKAGAVGTIDRPQRLPGHFKHHGDGPRVHHISRPPYHRHSWRQLFKNIASHILLPILIGVIAGVSVSLVGMAAGTMVVFLWRTFFRRPRCHRRGRAHKAAAREVAAAAAEEKSGLMKHQDPPPSYDEEEETAKKVDI